MLRYRLALATKAAGTGRGRRPAKLIVGLIPEALGPMAPDMRQALDERRNLIEQRARALADEAIRGKAPWTRTLGPRPADRVSRASWDQAAITVAAAYRARYGIEGRTLLGPKPATDSQCLDRARALAAIRRVEPASADLRPTDHSATLAL